MLTSAQLEQFREEGYVPIENAVPENLFDDVRAAANRATERTRRGKWPHKRGVGEKDIWGVHHLHHPALGEPIFAEYLASPVVLETVADLLSVADAPNEHLQLELVNMLVNPTTQNYELAWHRDLVPASLPPDQELAELRRQQYGVQWNTALYDDDCLHIVPRSHRRPKTDEEREIQRNCATDPLPDGMAVSLRAGQGVYYNANLLHRGVYRKEKRRETLHCCMGTMEGAFCRSLVYREMKWMREIPGFRDSLPKPLIPLYDNFNRKAEEYEESPR